MKEWEWNRSHGQDDVPSTNVQQDKNNHTSTIRRRKRRRQCQVVVSIDSAGFPSIKRRNGVGDQYRASNRTGVDDDIFRGVSSSTTTATDSDTTGTTGPLLSTCSTASTEDRYDAVIMRISSSDGLLQLDYSNTDNDDMGDDGIGRSSHASHLHVPSDHDHPPDHILVSTQSDDDSKRASLSFELTSTANQSHKDRVQKRDDQIRKACFEVALESYKKNQIPVPDSLLAQINEVKSNELQRRKSHDWNNCNFNSIGNTYEHHSSQTETKFIKRIRLSKEDEIHVHPCPCALNLVGMHPIISFEDDNSDSSSAGGDTTISSRIAPPSPAGRSTANTLPFEHANTHIITLIRNRQATKHTDFDRTVRDQGDSLAGFVDWDAITIKCLNHDEYDFIINSLKETSKANVVPFSPNPKERLKRMQKVKCKPCIEVDDSASILNKRIEFKQEISVDCVKESKAKKEVKRKIPWDFNFNKKEYCELCALEFTLLSRRHHCRKCERSCCGDCSSMMVVKGGEQTRFCNRCSADLLREQSQALHKNMQKAAAHSDVLPGTVHPSCYELGVGVFGKLPHWRHYLTSNAANRPAVGRITIEILEAMALPIVDMVNGKVDPYVRATITGYDRDMQWTLREWLSSKRFSLCGNYCSATLSPQWRGRGWKGGQLLTLPVISTAGAVLRLEVLHYNVMTNARGKDALLGLVEIPLSDIPNANLRHPGDIFDGYCDRWYRLLPSDHAQSNSIVLSKPISDPYLNELSTENKEKRKTGVKSLEEIGKRVQGIFIFPVEFFASAIKLDLPARRPEATCEQHKSRSMIHVRIKLNASEVGDALSHVWWPPIKPYPKIPAYDPQLLFNRIRMVGKLSAPYRKIFEFIEDVVKWKHDRKVCIKAYIVFAVHIIVFRYLLLLFHVYLFIFLGTRIKTKRYTKKSLQKSHSSLSFDSIETSSDESDKSGNDSNHPPLTANKSKNHTTDVNLDDKTSKKKKDIHSSPSLKELGVDQPSKKTPRSQKKPVHTVVRTNSIGHKTKVGNSNEDEEETAKLNSAVSWIAKRLGDNKGLEVLQFKLGMLSKDLRNINSVWDGSNPLLTRAAMIYLFVSFVLHFCIDRRYLWLGGTFVWYFAQSPKGILCTRRFFGVWRGIAKITRRQHLLDAEMLEVLSSDKRSQTVKKVM